MTLVDVCIFVRLKNIVCSLNRNYTIYSNIVYNFHVKLENIIGTYVSKILITGCMKQIVEIVLKHVLVNLSVP